MVSTKCTISRAETTRDSRNAIWECFWYQRARKYIGTPAASTSSPLRQSRANTVTAVNTMNSMPGGQRADPGIQEFAQRLQVRGLPGDDAAGGVLLVEFQAQPLGVPEDPDAQVQQHRLAEPRRRGHVQGGEARRRDRRGEVGDAGEHQREVVAGAAGPAGRGRCRRRSAPGPATRAAWDSTTAAMVSQNLSRDRADQRSPAGPGSAAGRSCSRSC